MAQIAAGVGGLSSAPSIVHRGIDRGVRRSFLTTVALPKCPGQIGRYKFLGNRSASVLGRGTGIGRTATH